MAPQEAPELPLDQAAGMPTSSGTRFAWADAVDMEDPDPQAAGNSSPHGASPEPPHAPHAPWAQRAQRAQQVLPQCSSSQTERMELMELMRRLAAASAHKPRLHQGETRLQLPACRGYQACSPPHAAEARPDLPNTVSAVPVVAAPLDQPVQDIKGLVDNEVHSGKGHGYHCEPRQTNDIGHHRSSKAGFGTGLKPLLKTPAFAATLGQQHLGVDDTEQPGARGRGVTPPGTMDTPSIEDVRILGDVQETARYGQGYFRLTRRQIPPVRPGHPLPAPPPTPSQPADPNSRRSRRKAGTQRATERRARPQAGQDAARGRGSPTPGVRQARLPPGPVLHDCPSKDEDSDVASAARPGAGVHPAGAAPAHPQGRLAFGVPAAALPAFAAWLKSPRRCRCPLFVSSYLERVRHVQLMSEDRMKSATCKNTFLDLESTDGPAAAAGARPRSSPPALARRR